LAANCSAGAKRHQRVVVHAGANERRHRGGGNGGTPGNGKGHNQGSVVLGAATPGNGNGHQGSAPLPVLVSGIDDVVQVAAGGWSSYALRADGTAWSWGDDSYGELGLSDPPNVKDADTATQIAGLPALKMR